MAGRLTREPVVDVICWQGRKVGVVGSSMGSGADGYWAWKLLDEPPAWRKPRGEDTYEGAIRSLLDAAGVMWTEADLAMYLTGSALFVTHAPELHPN